MSRVALLTWIVLTAAVCPFAATQMHFELYRQSLDPPVADEATPELELPENLREIGLTGNLAWPDDGDGAPDGHGTTATTPRGAATNSEAISAST